MAALFCFLKSSDLEGNLVERDISSPPFYTQQVGSQDGKCSLVLDVKINTGQLAWVQAALNGILSFCFLETGQK